MLARRPLAACVAMPLIAGPGALPLMIAEGAGAEMRQALGTTVFSGMVGVTFFGLVFTPTFYVVCRWMSEKLRALFGRGETAA